MKKLLSVFLLMVAVAAGWIFIFGNPVSRVNPADLLPADSYLYFEQKNGSEVWRNFVESPFGTSILNLDYSRIATLLQLEDQEKQAVLAQVSNIKKIKDDKLLNDIFGKQVILALVPSKEKINTDDPIVNFKDRFVLITKPKYSANLLETIAEQFYGESTLSSTEYENYTIKQIAQEGTPLSSVVIDGYFILSYQIDQIKNCIDVYEKKIPSLATDSEFTRHEFNAEIDDSFGFLSIDKIRQVMLDFSKILEEPYREMVEKEISEMNGFLSASYTGNNNKAFVDERVTIYFDKEKLKENVKIKLATAPAENKTIQWISDDNINYYWTNTLILQHLWDTYLNESDILPHLIMIEEAFYSVTGDDLKDFLGEFTGELAFFLDKSEGGQLIPVPGVSVFMKVKNKDRVITNINKLVEAYGIPLQNRKYKNVTYQSAGPFLQEDLQPLFGFVDGYFFIASSPKSVNEYIDRMNGGSNQIDIAELFPERETAFSAKNNVVTLVKVDELIQEIKQILIWGKNLLALQGKDQNEIDEVLNLLVFPLMDGAQMYKESGSRSYFTDESIIFESHTNIAQ